MSDRPKDRRFEMQIDINADRDAVWQALTEQREYERWFAMRAPVDLRVGGSIEWHWADVHSWRNTIEVLQPGQHLRLRYDSSVPAAGGGMRPLFVDFHLEGARGTTTLRLVHSGFGPEAGFDAEFDGIRAGWPVELRSLRLYLERHRGADRQTVVAIRTTPLAPEAVWRQLVGSRGLRAPQLTQLEEGQPFAVEIPGGGRLEGTALFVPGEREFSGVVRSHGDAWLRLHCERWGGATNVWLWLALYGQPPATVRALQQAFDRLVDGAIGAAAEAPDRGALA